jgi:methylated-DNA-[protein]-cysteine S-methyltransferase
LSSSPVCGAESANETRWGPFLLPTTSENRQRTFSAGVTFGSMTLQDTVLEKFNHLAVDDRRADDDLRASAWRVDTIASPIGDLLIVTDSSGTVRGVDWLDHGERLRSILERPLASRGAVLVPGTAPAAVRCAIDAYFQGDVFALDALPVEADGSRFQRTVWAALRTIPAATTATYGEIAARIGAPRAARAVGLANHNNPISVIVPCHRVIGASGALTGYAGGVERKRWLIAHERAAASPAHLAHGGVEECRR